MSMEKLHQVLDIEKLQGWIQSGLAEAGISSMEMLADDHKVENAARGIYKKIPLFPIRTAIKTAIGEYGFVKLIFRVRDKMVEQKSMDLAWLNVETLKTMISRS